jgi:hypothetical protein
MFTKPPFTYFEITSHPNIFCKNNPRFFCNYKNTLFTCTLNFQELHINNMSLIQTNTYFTLTNICLALQIYELSQWPLRTPQMVQHGQSLFYLAGPWNGIRPWLAVTLRNDTRFRAELGVNLRDVCSRLLISSAVTLHKLA